jgi:hypothetical protein
VQSDGMCRVFLLSLLSFSFSALSLSLSLAPPASLSGSVCPCFVLCCFCFVCFGSSLPPCRLSSFLCFPPLALCLCLQKVDQNDSRRISLVGIANFHNQVRKCPFCGTVVSWLSRDCFYLQSGWYARSWCYA